MRGYFDRLGEVTLYRVTSLKGRYELIRPESSTFRQKELCDNSLPLPGTLIEWRLKIGDQ